MDSDAMQDINNLGTAFPSGNENEVYYNEKEDVVYKVNNLFNAGSIPALLEQIELHNQIFTHSQYELYGFTGFEGRSFFPILKQKYIGNATNATPNEITEYMQKLGFEPTGKARFSNEIEVSDLHPRNVLKDTKGNIYVIDDIVKETRKKESPSKLPQFADKPLTQSYSSADICIFPVCYYFTIC